MPCQNEVIVKPAERHGTPSILWQQPAVRPAREAESEAGGPAICARPRRTAATNGILSNSIGARRDRLLEGVPEKLFVSEPVLREQL